MKFNFYASTILGCALLVTSCSHHEKKEMKETQAAAEAQAMPAISNESMATLMSDWPETSKGAANAIVAKYGLPSSITKDAFVWNNTAPFKRTIVYREEVLHRFPVEHYDVLQQFVDYKVPADKADELAKFDGSVYLDRTKGELSARCDKEEMNFLALNLSDKIVRGELTAEAARREFNKTAEAFAMGTSNEYLTGLNFRMEGNTQDPDRMYSGSTIKRTIQAQEVKRTEEIVE